MKTGKFLSFTAAVLSTAALYAGPDWTGAASTDWWNPANWHELSELPETWNDPYFGWQIGPSSATTVDLGGQTISTTHGIIVTTEYPVTITNGTINVGDGWLQVMHASENGAVLKLADVDVTIPQTLSLGELWEKTGPGTVILESGSLSATDFRAGNNPDESATLILNGGEARFHWVCCSAKGDGETGRSRFVLNGGTLKIPDFSYVSWEAPLNEANGTTNINSTLVFNGGTLKAWPNNNNEIYGYNFVPKWMKVVVDEGGAVIDSNGYDITFAATNITTVANDGGLTKKGEGKLTVAKGVVWSGPTKVLGGTLDLNGGTITGPVVFGGNGRIVNATIATDDITIMNGYEFIPQDFAATDTENNTYLLNTLTVGAGTSTIAPMHGLLASAAGWFDPSDSTTITADGNGGIVRIANKGSAGSALDAEIVNDEVYITDQGHTGLELPYIGEMNGLGALVFTNNITGFQTARLQFPSTNGKAVFAVSKRMDSLLPDGYSETKASVFPVEWIRGSYVWDGYGWFGIRQTDGWQRMQYRYIDANDGNAKDKEISWNYWGENTTEDDTVYVSSFAANAKDGNGRQSISARSDRLKDGELSSIATSAESIALHTDDEMRYRLVIGWSKLLQWSILEKNIPSVSSGMIGEILAYNRELAAFETEMIHAYLDRKWLSNSIEMPSANIAIESLTLGGTVDLENSNLSIENLSGSGAIANAKSVDVNGVVTAKLADGSTPVFAVSAPLDLTGATLILDESEIDFTIGKKFTLFTADSITGSPSLLLESGDARQFKIVNTGSALTIERLAPGFIILLR